MPMSSRYPIAASEAEQLQIIAVAKALQAHAATKLVTANGDECIVPESILQVLALASSALANGQTVTLVPGHRELTTQEAAYLLNVSRPYLIQLLEKGELAYMMTGTHRRLRLDDVLTYKAKQEAKADAALAELTQLSQDMGLYEDE